MSETSLEDRTNMCYISQSYEIRTRWVVYFEQLCKACPTTKQISRAYVLPLVADPSVTGIVAKLLNSVRDASSNDCVI